MEKSIYFLEKIGHWVLMIYFMPTEQRIRHLLEWLYLNSFIENHVMSLLQLNELKELSLDASGNDRNYKEWINR